MSISAVEPARRGLKTASSNFLMLLFQRPMKVPLKLPWNAPGWIAFRFGFLVLYIKGGLLDGKTKDPDRRTFNPSLRSKERTLRWSNRCTAFGTVFILGTLNKEIKRTLCEAESATISKISSRIPAVMSSPIRLTSTASMFGLFLLRRNASTTSAAVLLLQ